MMLSDYQKPAEPLLSILGGHYTTVQVFESSLDTLIPEEKANEILDRDHEKQNILEIMNEVFALTRKLELDFSNDSTNDNITEQDSQKMDGPNSQHK